MRQTADRAKNRGVEANVTQPAASLLLSIREPRII